MATPEALIKYYDCLKNSFDKIQDKNNETALVNAALRPKIGEELVKDEKLLKSYLDYIIVFCTIYDDSFASVCSSIIVPLIKGDADGNFSRIHDDHYMKRLSVIHDSVSAILKSKPNLSNEFAHCLVKQFPSIIITNEEKVTEVNQLFFRYVESFLRCLNYLPSESLSTILSSLIDRLNPPPTMFVTAPDTNDLIQKVDETLDKSYQSLYEALEKLSDTQQQDVYRVLIQVFVHEYLSTHIRQDFRYLILFVASQKEIHLDHLLELLMTTFLDHNQSMDDRMNSIKLASSILARSKLADLDRALNFLARVSSWCIVNLVDQNTKADSELFYSASEAIFYLITQRYREMYEEETVSKIVKMNLDKIVACQRDPASFCDAEVIKRFKEVVTLIRITNVAQAFLDRSQLRKRRKSDRHRKWFKHYPEDIESVPDRIRPIYRAYYSHRNFTVFREK